MYKIGDIIRIRKDCYFYPWYSEEIFTVVDVDFKRTLVCLDRDLPETNSNAIICFDYIIHDYLYIREDKINKIKEKWKMIS